MFDRKFAMCALISAFLIMGCANKDSNETMEGHASDNPYAGYAGDWLTEAYVGTSAEPDVVVMLSATDNSEGWAWKFSHMDDAVPSNNIFLKGDTVVTEIGPYPSALRDGMTVTNLVSYIHQHGAEMSGRFVATYSDGSEARGRLHGERVD